MTNINRKCLNRAVQLTTIDKSLGRDPLREAREALESAIKEFDALAGSSRQSVEFKEEHACTLLKSVEAAENKIIHIRDRFKTVLENRAA